MSGVARSAEDLIRRGDASPEEFLTKLDPALLSPAQEMQLVIYLRAKGEVLHRCITKKNKPMEHETSDEYLEVVVGADEHFFHQ